MTSLELIHDLWAKSDPAECCPHVSHDAEGCRCAVVAEEDNSRAVCDPYSLQL